MNVSVTLAPNQAVSSNLQRSVVRENRRIRDSSAKTAAVLSRIKITMGGWWLPAEKGPKIKHDVWCGSVA